MRLKFTQLFAIGTVVCSVLVFFGGCSGSDGASDDCREFPEDCEGDIGGFCDRSSDCFDGTCCTDKNCGGGMCTLRCSDDRDCPDIMGCEHGYCFYLCDSDADCARGQECEHGKTICEYEK